MIKFLFLSLFLTSLAHAKIEINWWHSMSGSRGKVLKDMVEQYNKSQNQYHIVATYKGHYTESLNGAIAAFRGSRQPHILQVFEVGTLTMMNSGAVYPVQDLLEKNGYHLDWDSFLGPVLSFYRDKNDRLMSMPFNSSTPVVFYNENILKDAGINKIPETWEELYQASETVVSKTGKCGLVVGWQSWVLVENFSSIHNIPMSNQGNGFDGLADQLLFDNEKVVANLDHLRKQMKNDAFVYEGRRSDPARNAFIGKKCAFAMDSSSSIGTMEKLAKFPFGVAQLPYHKGTKPKNSIIGGATLWVFSGHDDNEYKGVAHFLNYVSSTEVQMWWHEKTGYLPISKKAYEILKKQKFYEEKPYQEIAVKQLLRGTPSPVTRGIRLGNFTKIRKIINDELEKLWGGKQDAKEAMKVAIKRGNRVLGHYVRNQKKRMEKKKK